jgi:hypothetical protein
MSIDPITALPVDAYLNVLSYLNKPELAKCCTLSSIWNRASNDKELWRELAKRTFKGALQVPCEKNFLKRHAYQQINTNDKLIEQIEAFLKQIQVGEKVKFICFFGEGTKYQTVSVAIFPNIPNQLGCQLVDNYVYDYSVSYFSKNKLIDGELSTDIDINSKLNRNNNFSMDIELNDAVTSISTSSYNAHMRVPKFIRSSPLEIRIRHRIIEKIDQLEAGQHGIMFAFRKISHFFFTKREE